VESTGQESMLFLFQVLLKPILIHQEGPPRRFPTNNDWVGRGMGGSQAEEGGLGHLQATCMSPKLFLLLACLNTISWSGLSLSDFVFFIPLQIVLLKFFYDQCYILNMGRHFLFLYIELLSYNLL
jgi:hypothetical protein